MNKIKLYELADIINSELEYIVSENIKQKLKICSIIFGQDKDAESYLKGIQKKSSKLNIELDILQLDNDISQDNFNLILNNINNDPYIHGILLQSPYSKNLDKEQIYEKINPIKDIDGISYYNQARIYSGKPFLIPATAWSVLVTLKYIEKKYNYSLKGKNVSIIGRSLIVGKPVLHLLLNIDTTPTIIHTKSINANEISKKSDIVIACCGVKQLIDDKWIKEDAIVIDVGIHCFKDSNNEYKICGDVSNNLNNGYIVTAVPGGIGLITSLLICANLIKSYIFNNSNKLIKFNFEN